MDRSSTLYSSSYLDIHFLKENLIHLDWKGYISVEQVKEGCELGLKEIYQTGSSLIINDNRKVKGSWTQAIRWLEEDFMPRLVELRPVKIAFLYSPFESARYSVNRLLEVNDQYSAQSFEDFEEAGKWLTGNENFSDIHSGTLFIKTLADYSRIELEEICYISSDKGKAVIHSLDKDYSTRMTLVGIKELLPSAMFCRIHKCHIVNVSKILKIKYHAGGAYHLYLKGFGKVYLPVGRTYAGELKMLLQTQD
ncbi:MAG: LytTR family transcriptional regulator [Bacteroidia bacterium]|nr:LytTR family transcriptional regulator [Bacteroidia bacterium]